MAKRIAEELNTPMGEVVGFNDRTGPNAAIKLMTDGILLAESQRDPLLRATTPSSSTRRTSAASTSISCWAT